MIANAGIFGKRGLLAKTPQGLMAQVVGRKQFTITKFAVAPFKKPGRIVQGVWIPERTDPYLVEHADQPFHPGGNSICYAVQWALLMGADPIYLMGFTLQNGGGYEFGRVNPHTKKPTFYRDPGQVLDWLRLTEKTYPGRVRLVQGPWEGPLHQIFRAVNLDGEERGQEG